MADRISVRCGGVVIFQRRQRSGCLFQKEVFCLSDICLVKLFGGIAGAPHDFLDFSSSSTPERVAEDKFLASRIVCNFFEYHLPKVIPRER